MATRNSITRLAKELVMSARPVVHMPRLLVAVLLLAAIARTALAQQIPAARPARTTATAPLGTPSIVPSDSVARYARAAHAQRWTGGSLLAVGVATMAGAYAQYVHAGRMGMTGGQLATLAAGASVGAFGAARWTASRASMATAARWEARERGAWSGLRSTAGEDHVR
jgi:hypothetical protein